MPDFSSRTLSDPPRTVPKELETQLARVEKLKSVDAKVEALDDLDGIEGA